MGKRVILVVAVLALVAAACTKSSTTATPTAAGITVQLDGKTDQFNGAFPKFFPNSLTVHPGSTVTFALPHFTGEPHTVTLGSLVNAAAAKTDALGTKVTFPQLANMDLTPEFNKLPDVFFHKPPAGPPSPNQSAAQPCYQASGEPPLSLTGSAPACANKTLTDFKGTESFYNAGLLVNDGASFKLKLASDIKPGRYAYMCMIHRAGMRGWITVVPNSQSADTAASVRSRGQAQFNDLVTKLQPFEAKLASATKDTALGGAGSDSIPDALIAEWGPKKLTVHKGDTVKWKLFLFHNVALNAPESAVGIFNKTASGAFDYNGPAVASVNSPQPPLSTAFFPPPAGAGPLTVTGGPWDGKAFRNSSLLGSITPFVITYTTTFTTPGTYSLRCLIHPDMKGTVTVI